MRHIFMYSLFLCIIKISTAQYTAIPDTNFELALINLNIDTEGIVDGQVLTNDINFITYLDVSDKGIYDLTGIEGFVELKMLYCYHNNLTFLNTSNNYNLEVLFCGGNHYLEPLDLSNNLNLNLLECAYSNLSTLDVSNNILLEVLFCGNEYDLKPFNTISELDLSANVNLINVNVFDLFTLENLDLSNNPNLEVVNASMAWIPAVLTTINVANGNNEILTEFYATDNENLLCIQVDEEEVATNGEFPYTEWVKNPEAIYLEDCNLGILPLENEAVNFYPNPLNRFLNIETNMPIKSIKIYNVLGNLLIEERDPVNQIDVSHLASGVLFVQLEGNQGVLIRRLIKL